MKQNLIKQIKALVNQGLFIKVTCENKNIILWQEQEKYIHWRHYGQSAIKNTLKDLNWLINDLFEAKHKKIDFKIVEHIF